MKTLCVLVTMLASACAISGSSDGSDQQAAGTTQYVDIMDFGTTDQGAWYDTISKLNQEFIATGEFANITPLTFGCSVSSKEGTVHDCAWSFASADIGIDSKSAAVGVDAPTYVCHTHPKTTAAKLIAQLAGSDDAIHATLPGSVTIADSFADCFAHPIGGAPLTTTVTSPATYVDADDYYASAASQAKWTATKAALVLGFNNICGDTFCGSDFGDLESLALTCSITKSSGNIKSCMWVFGGSWHQPDKTGALDVTAKTFSCPFDVHGTLPQLITTITAAGTDEPIQRALPGGTASSYDALGGCLP